MAKYIEDYSFSEMNKINNNNKEKKCFSFAGETNLGKGLDLDKFDKNWEVYSKNVHNSVDRIISNNQDLYI